MDTVPMWMKNLDDEDMIFIKRFLLASGSLKEVAKQADTVEDMVLVTPYGPMRFTPLSRKVSAAST